MTVKRDWLTIPEYAKRIGLSRSGVFRQIERGTFQPHYEKTSGLFGLILIYSPNAESQKTEAQSQENLAGTACDRAGTK